MVRTLSLSLLLSLSGDVEGNTKTEVEVEDRSSRGRWQRMPTLSSWSGATCILRCRSACWGKALTRLKMIEVESAQPVRQRRGIVYGIDTHKTS